MHNSLLLQHLEHNNLPAQPHTTHGRAVARVFTLQGHRDPPPVPLGRLDVQDSDGRVVANFAERNRRASSVGRESAPSTSGTSVIGSGKFEAIRRNTSKSVSKRGSFFGGQAKVPAVERPNVRDIWKYVVKHQVRRSESRRTSPVSVSQIGHLCHQVAT